MRHGCPPPPWEGGMCHVKLYLFHQHHHQCWFLLFSILRKTPFYSPPPITFLAQLRSKNLPLLEEESLSVDFFVNQVVLWPLLVSQPASPSVSFVISTFFFLSPPLFPPLFLWTFSFVVTLASFPPGLFWHNAIQWLLPVGDRLSLLSCCFHFRASFLFKLACPKRRVYKTTE